MAMAEERATVRGTTECPICGWPEPHFHTPEEIAQRPGIDGARMAFEREAREFMMRPHFKGVRTGFWWAFDAELARTSEASELGGPRWAHGWSQRDWPAGRYSNEFVEVMWQFWRMAWLSSRKGQQCRGSADVTL